jgi:hypothetical protein
MSYLAHAAGPHSPRAQLLFSTDMPGNTRTSSLEHSIRSREQHSVNQNSPSSGSWWRDGVFANHNLAIGEKVLDPLPNRPILAPKHNRKTIA